VKTQSPDTHSTAEAVQIELLRKASVADRLEKVWSLSRTVSQLALEGIRRAHPNASQEELLLLYVSIHYGQEIADGLRQYQDETRR
jgi:hypothetical protein